jgi:hypothetical protein
MTDPTGLISWPNAACNYYAGANVDDGSCVYNPGCTDPNATNYDPSADMDDGSCGVVPATCENLLYANVLEACDDFACLVASQGGPPPITPCSSILGITTTIGLATHWFDIIDGGGYYDAEGNTISVENAGEMENLFYECCILDGPE